MRKQHLIKQGKIRIIAAAGFAALVISGSLASAANVTWDNSSGDAKWYTATNWNTNSVPTTLDDITLPAGVPGGDSTIDLSGPSSAECAELDVNDSYSFINGSLDVVYGHVFVSDGATARVGEAISSNTSGNGWRLIKNGAGTLVLTTPGASLLPITIDNGIVRLQSAGIIGVPTVDEGALELGGITFDQDVNLNGGSVSATGTSALTGTVFFGGGFGFTSNGLLTVGNLHDISPFTGKTTYIRGAGVVELTQPSTVFTRWEIDGATLQVSADAQLGKSTNPIAIDGGTFSVTGTFTANRPVSIGNSGGTINVSAGNTLILNAPLSGQANYPAELDINGPGQLTLTQPSTFQGNTRIGNGATVRLENATALGVNNVGGILLVGSTLELDNVSLANQYFPVGLIGSAHDVIRGIGPNSALKLDYPLGTPQPFAMQMRFETGSDPSDALAVTCDTLPGSSDSMFTIAGAGTVTMSMQSYQGRWSVESGTLRATTDTALGIYPESGSSVLVGGGGTLFADNCSLGRINLADGASMLGNNGKIDQISVDDSANANLRTVGATTLTCDDTFVAGTGSTIHVKGPGQVILNMPSAYAASTYAGDWSLDGGTLQIINEKQLGPDTDKLIFNGGTLLLSNGFTFHRAMVVKALGGTVEATAFSPLFLGPMSGPGTLTKTGAGQLRVLSIDLGGLNVMEGNVQMESKIGSYRIGSLSITADASMDLNQAHIVVTSTPLGTWNGAEYTDLTGLLQTGRNGGTWNGAGGIVSSDSRAASGLCAVGIASASQVLGIDSTATGIWHGQTVTGTDSLIAFTYGGDANLDGKINIDDYGRIDSNVGRSGSVFGWYNGDFNYDGKINIDDYGIIDSNIGAQGAPLGGASQSLGAVGESLDVTAVPEPASMGLLLAGSLLLRRRRRGLAIC